MPRKPAPRGATPLTPSETPLHRRPLTMAGDRRRITVGHGVVIVRSRGTAASQPLPGTVVSPPSKNRLLPSLSRPCPRASSLRRPAEPPWRDFAVQDGDNLSLIFNRAGFTDTDLYRVARANDDRSLKRIYPGETIGFQSNVEGDLLTLRHIQSPLINDPVFPERDVYVATDLAKQPDRVARDISMTIDSSLFIAGTQAGLSDAMIMELAGIFGGVIDFVLDPRTGDTIHVLYEELMLDGARFDDGPILAASFTNRGETFEAYRYTDVEGDTSYYNQRGVSMRKAFLLAPLDFTRVSSNFNPNRLHPIYKTQRPHRGTDYAAPRGTPVYAAGDGRVIEAGYTRANGNYAFIQHGEQFETHYLHLHRLKVKKGVRVTQGDVIGTVGSTGAATGPHLHYEFLVNGVHRNPRTVHKMLPKARSLPEDELPRYLASIRQPTQQLASLRSAQQLASVE